MNSSMDISFIDRTLKTTGVLALLALAFGWMYFPIYNVLAVFFGAIWSILNIYFLTLLITSSLRPDGIDKLTVAGLFLIKMPLLYAAGYFLIKNPIFEIPLLLIGFTSIFAVMVLKVLARVMLGIDDKQPATNTKRQEAH